MYRVRSYARVFSENGDSPVIHGSKKSQEMKKLIKRKTNKRAKNKIKRKKQKKKTKIIS